MRLRTMLLTVTVVLLFANSLVWANTDGHKKSAEEFPSDVASVWFEELYDVVKAEKTSPPAAARIYGVVAVALYESIVAGTEENRSLVGQLNGLMSVPQPRKNKKYYWPAVANAAIAETIRGLYPTISQISLDAINNLEQSFLSQQQVLVPRPEHERSVAYGRAVASAILTWASNDGFSIYSNCPYVPIAVQGAWEPTPPLFNPNPLQPCWGLIRPMVLTSGGECHPPDHPLFSTEPDSEFYVAALEVYKVRLSLTEEQKTIANYWSDNAGATGTPSGHWIAIVSQIARNDGLSLASAAEAYVSVGMAVHDAFIQCWNTKYIYDLQRPVTFINNNIDGNWLPYLVTPGFPSYTSGHSAQSGAAARVLTDMFGSKAFTDTTNTDHGLVPPQEPRTFDSFDDAAGEAAVSRMYGGIHFRFDNEKGFASGECVGQAIHDRVRFREADED